MNLSTHKNVIFDLRINLDVFLSSRLYLRMQFLAAELRTVEVRRSLNVLPPFSFSPRKLDPHYLPEIVPCVLFPNDAYISA